MALVFLGFSQPAMADQTKDFTFNVNVSNVLDVSVSPTKVSASGEVNEFLRTSALVTISTNSEYGATANITTKTATTALTNGSATIPTLSSNTTRDNFATGHWGVSSTDTTEGSGSSTYMPLQPFGSATPTPVLQTSGRGEYSRTIYFGMKAGEIQTSGKYTNTVVLAVVANNAPVVPPDPIKPEEPTGGGSNAPARTAPRTVAVTRPTTSEDEAEEEHEAPQGVEEEYNYDENIHYGSNMAGSTAVVIAGTVAAGLILFVVAKRRDDDDEEEEA